MSIRLPGGGGGAGSGAYRGARASRSTAQSIPDVTWTSVQPDTEQFDTDAFHDNVTNPSRFTVPAGLAGKYRVTAYVSFANATTGFRYVALAKNGIRAVENNVANNNGAGFVGHMLTDVFDCAVGDYLEGFVYQNSGAALNIAAGSYVIVEYVGA